MSLPVCQEVVQWPSSTLLRWRPESPPRECRQSPPLFPLDLPECPRRTPQSPLASQLLRPGQSWRSWAPREHGAAPLLNWFMASRGEESLCWNPRWYRAQVMHLIQNHRSHLTSNDASRQSWVTALEPAHCLQCLLAEKSTIVGHLQTSLSQLLGRILLWLTAPLRRVYAPNSKVRVGSH